MPQKIFPALLKKKSTDDPIRFWIAGCATGEEAYSIAICLHEFLGKKISSYRIQIFASDISDMAIKKARAGIYSKADVQAISEERLSTYFTKIDGSFQVNKVIRDLCIFANHNFLKDPPFAKIDLITCRNVLIYMGTFLQKKAFTNFHYALNVNGLLLLGKSETASTASELFTPFDKQDKVYARTPVHARFMQVATERREEALVIKNNEIFNNIPPLPDFRKSAEAILISRSPAAVIVNEQMDIVHIHGDVTAFLKPPPGKPTFNLLKMAREGLSFEIRNALHKAKITNEPVVKKDIPLADNSKKTLITIEILQLNDAAEMHHLILFIKNPLPEIEEISKAPSPKTKNGEAQKRNENLEKELAHTREDMRAITENMEAANEELQSANEELQSSNEEMQSLNEELETSKEEMQSSNEELTIMNQELLDKQEQLNVARYYSEAIISTVRDSLLVLDHNMRVKTANDSFYKTFRLAERDVEGTLFYELQNRKWDNPELRTLLEKILPEKKKMADFEVVLQFPFLGERHLLLNAQQIVNDQSAEQLILLAIDDITENKLAKKVKESEEQMRSLANSIPQLAWMMDPEGSVYWYNQRWYDYTGTTLEEMKGWGWQAVHHPDTVADVTTLFKKAITDGEPYEQTFLLRSKKGDYRWFLTRAIPLRNDEGKIMQWFGTNTDVTEQRNIEDALKESEEKFRGLAETLPQLVWITDEKGTAMYFSRSWSTYSGLDPYTAESWAEMVHPDDLTAVNNLWSNCIATGTTYHSEVRLKNKDEQYRWHVVEGVPLLNEDKTISKWIGAYMDIHEQKTKEQQKDEFISIASHEMKTPLTSAKGYIELLMLTNTEAENKPAALYAAKANEAVNRLHNLVIELLDASKIQNGKLNYNIAEFDFADMIRETVENIQMGTKTHKIKISGNIEQQVNGDKERLQQVVFNLLTNAIKYSPNASEVLVHLAQTENTIEVTVTDFGIGIATVHLDKIFDRYYRVQEHAIHFQGLGIGLYISYEIIQRHHGTMSAESKVGVGSVFHFTLPL